MNRFAISNLAFKNHSIGDVLSFLKDSGIDGLEIAPSLIWENPPHISNTDKRDFNHLVTNHGLSVVALQSLLYGEPELQLFGSSKTQKNLLDHLKKMTDLCVDLGGRSISFGSPNNRLKGKLPLDKAISIASPLFRELAEYAKLVNVIVCMEPISSLYNCDFINNTKECIKLIESVQHSNFKLLLDTGTLISNQEDFNKIIEKYIHLIDHIHINDPQLFPPSSKRREHTSIANTLRLMGYSNWLTLEFMQPYRTLKQDIIYGVECYR